MRLNLEGRPYLETVVKRGICNSYSVESNAMDTHLTGAKYLGTDIQRNGIY